MHSVLYSREFSAQLLLVYKEEIFCITFRKFFLRKKELSQGIEHKVYEFNSFNEGKKTPQIT